MRFTRQQHVRTSADFSEIRASGTNLECGFFYMTYRNASGRTPPLRRLGVVASRRVGNAVHRNRAKRRLREVFRLHQDQLPESCDVILVARRSIHRAEFSALEKRFERAAGKIRGDAT